MAYISFNNLSETAQQSQQNNSQVGFFSLKNDGDEAIVRFMHDDTDSFEILGTHPIRVNGRFRRINCIRNPHDPISACPFCESGENIEYRFFIHLLQYTNNSDGTVSIEPKVWERSISYANKLREYLNNYGPMSDIICKIVRHGKPGDMKTEYEIIPNLNQQIYKPDVFKKVTDLFDDYKALGRVVLDRSLEDIKVFLNTGDFPMQEQTEEKKSEPIQTPNWSGETDLPVWSVDVKKEQRPNPVWGQPTTDSKPVWSNNSSNVQRPNRF